MIEFSKNKFIDRNERIDRLCEHHELFNRFHHYDENGNAISQRGNKMICIPNKASSEYIYTAIISDRDAILGNLETPYPFSFKYMYSGNINYIMKILKENSPDIQYDVFKLVYNAIVTDRNPLTGDILDKNYIDLPLIKQFEKFVISNMIVPYIPQRRVLFNQTDIDILYSRLCIDPIGIDLFYKIVGKKVWKYYKMPDGAKDIYTQKDKGMCRSAAGDKDED